MIGPWTEKTLARHWDIHKKQKVGKCHFVPQADHKEKKQHVLHLGIATCIGSVLPTVFLHRPRRIENCFHHLLSWQ
jgi:hypothetical protein